MNNDYNKRLGKRLKKIRENKNLTQIEVAKLSNGKFNKNILSNYERGETSMPAYVIPTLCKIYDLTPNQLLGWKDESNDREMSIIDDILKINEFTNEIATKYTENSNILIAASGAENLDDDEREKLNRDIEMVKNLE